MVKPLKQFDHLNLKEKMDVLEKLIYLTYNYPTLRPYINEICDVACSAIDQEEKIAVRVIFTSHFSFLVIFIDIILGCIVWLNLE